MKMNAPQLVDDLQLLKSPCSKSFSVHRTFLSIHKTAMRAINLVIVSSYFLEQKQFMSETIVFP